MQQALAPAHNRSTPVSGRPLQLVIRLERMETPKYYPGSAVTHPPSTLEQLVSNSNKEQTPRLRASLVQRGRVTRAACSPSVTDRAWHRTGFGQTPPAPSSTSYSSARLHCCVLIALGCTQGTVRDSKDGVMENKRRAPRDRLIPTPARGC